MKTQPMVYIIIVNWNGWQDTIECLDSIVSCDYDNYTILICDNGSSDDSVQRLTRWASKHSFVIDVRDNGLHDTVASQPGQLQIVIFRSQQNLGFAGANNVALRYALHRNDFSYVWLLNNDTVVDRNALSALVQRMDEKPDAGMCGSTLLLYNYRERVQAMGGGYYCRWIGLPWHLGRLRTAKRLLPAERGERWMNYIVGASLMVSRSFLYDIGLLCEEYFLYFEETDWAVRAKGRYSLAYSPTSIVYHKVGASIGTSSDPRKKSLICDFYSIRNRIYFTRKFYPYALPSVYFFLLFSVGARLILGQWKRAFMILHLMATGGSFPIWPFAVWDNRVVGKNC